MNRLTTNFAELTLKNPIIASSAGTTKDALHCKRAEEAGCGAVILKSIQEELVNRYVSIPRMTVIHSGIPGYSSTSFMSYEQAFEGGIEEYCQEIRKAKEICTIPVIASLECAHAETWPMYAEKCQAAGADAIEVAPSCPVGVFIRDGEDFLTVADQALKVVKQAVRIPVGIKMSQQMTNPCAAAIELDSRGADWITMFNRNPGLQIDIETMEPIMNKGFCGHGGPWVSQSVMRWIAMTYPHIHAPIAATGGVTNYEDVVRYLLSGARTVEIATLFYLKGFGVTQKILEELEDYLDRHKIGQIKDIIGYAAGKVLPLDQVDHSRRYVAHWDSDACIGCGKCLPVCIYGAISDGGNRRPVINTDICDGCGLCASVCNRAITMQVK